MAGVYTSPAAAGFPPSGAGDRHQWRSWTSLRFCASAYHLASHAKAKPGIQPLPGKSTKCAASTRYHGRQAEQLEQIRYQQSWRSGSPPAVAHSTLSLDDAEGAPGGLQQADGGDRRFLPRVRRGGRWSTPKGTPSTVSTRAMDADRDYPLQRVLPTHLDGAGERASQARSIRQSK